MTRKQTLLDDAVAAGDAPFLVAAQGNADGVIWSGAAGVSLKRFIGGDAYYRMGKLTRRVDPYHYFIVNEGQHYEIEIDSPSRVGSRCLFFRDGLIGCLLYTSPSPRDRG